MRDKCSTCSEPCSRISVYYKVCMHLVCVSCHYKKVNKLYKSRCIFCNTESCLDIIVADDKRLEKISPSVLKTLSVDEIWYLTMPNSNCGLCSNQSWVYAVQYYVCQHFLCIPCYKNHVLGREENKCGVCMTESNFQICGQGFNSLQEFFITLYPFLSDDFDD